MKLKRLLLGAFSVMLAVGVTPIVAFGADAPPDYGGENVTQSDNGSFAGEATEEEKAAQAAEQIVDEGGSARDTAADGSTVVVSKSIEATGIEDLFDITLGVQVEEPAHDNSTAVVVVMDVSNTMNENEAEATPNDEGSTNSRLQNAQNAANEFIREYCAGENLAADRMFGLVTFNTNAQWADGLGLQVVSGDSATSLQSSVNAITAPSTPVGERFTNMEAGLRLAYNALNGVQAAHKYVVFLTDGFPTTYIDRSIVGNEDNTESVLGYNPYESEGYIATKVGEDGYFADAVLGLPCTYGTSYSDKAALRAEEIAALMKAGNADVRNAGINIFSVGIDIGSQTVQAYVDRATGTFSIVDRTGEDYVIGSATDAQAYRDWLGSHIAGGPNLDEDSRAYADGDNKEELLDAFADILADIREVTGFPFPVAMVNDPMGEYIEFLHFFNNNGAPANSLTGEFGVSNGNNRVENTVVFDAVANAISWNLKQSGYTLIQNEDGSRSYMFELRYRVRLMTEAMGFPFGEAIPTNNDAILNYEVTDPQGEITEGSLVFPNPSVRAFAEDPVVPDEPSDKPGVPTAPTQPTNPAEQVNLKADTHQDSTLLPQTGDSMLLMGIAAVASIVAVVALVVFVRKGISR